MINSRSHSSFRTRAALALLSCTGSIFACSSQSDTDTHAGAAGVPTAGSTYQAGSGGGGASGASGGALGSGGNVGASAGNSSAINGSAGLGGNAENGGNAGNNALAGDCAATCAAQTALACSNGADCQADCFSPANTTAPSVKCQAEYVAMIHCDAPLTAPQWMCSQDAAPVPVADQCTSAVCAYACCVGALVADQDLWSRCMPMCD